MKNYHLVLMRHAKSSWADSSISDFDRPLNDRGRKSAPLMKTWLEKHALVPDCLLCSTAKRAQQTADIVCKAWSLSYSQKNLQELYLASPNTILSAIHQNAPREARTLMVIGHNPGLEVFASMLAGQAIEMPTAAVAVFHIPQKGAWQLDLSEHRVQLDHFVVPRSLDPGSE